MLASSPLHSIFTSATSELLRSRYQSSQSELDIIGISQPAQAEREFIELSLFLQIRGRHRNTTNPSSLAGLCRILIRSFSESLFRTCARSVRAPNNQIRRCSIPFLQASRGQLSLRFLYLHHLSDEEYSFSAFPCEPPPPPTLAELVFLY